MDDIKITDDKVITFYKRHPHICINAVNRMIVDLLEHNQAPDPNDGSAILARVTDALDNISNATKQILSNVETSVLETTANDGKMFGSLMETNNATLISQMVDTIHKVLPDTNTQHYNGITKSLDTFYKSITNDNQRLLDAAGSHSIKDYMTNLEMKTTIMLQNLQQPIYSFISASEDRINKNITATRPTENPEIYSKMVADIGSLISSHRVPATVRENCDKHLLSLLTKTFNSADISFKSLGMVGNTMLLKRMRKPTVYIQNYDSECNVSSDETNQFMTVISDDNVCGVFLSQQSGISGKTDFQIELHNNNVIVFVHNADYSSSKIEVAISIIDNLHNQLRQFVKSGNTDEFTIPKELLESINNEYQMFIAQKTAVIDVFKESQKKVLAQIDEIRFPCLDRYLSTKYSAPIVKSGLKCDLCKSYNANNLKALAAHKRGCSRKLNVQTKRPIASADVRNQICITPISFERTTGN